MHPYFWLIIFCAVIAITISIVLNKKKEIGIELSVYRSEKLEFVNQS